MKTLRRLFVRLRNVIARRGGEQRLREEMESHIASQTEDNIRVGMAPEEARRQALMKFGPIELMREEYQAERRILFIDVLLQDLRFALRMLAKSPGFSAIAIITLALGIGANAAIFSVVNAVLLRPLPFPHPEALFAISEANPQEGDGQDTGTSYVNFAAWRDQNHSFSEVAGYQLDDLTLTGVGDPSVLDTAIVTPGLFPLLEIKPILGRAFTPDDDKQGAAPVVILSENLWRSRFGHDMNVIGKSINLDKRPFTVVGIMPASFRFPLSAQNEDIWIPLASDPLFSGWMTRPGGHWLRVIGRLQPGVSLKQVQTEMSAIALRLAKEFPEQDSGWAIHMMPLHQMIVGNVKSLLLILLSAVVLVLLIACANVANLLLARATSRSKEIAVRIALGASKRRIVRQLFTENVILGLLGGGGGVLLASWGVSALNSLLPSELSQVHSIRVDSAVLGFAFALSVAASLLFGFAPALFAEGSDPQTNLREGARSGEARGSQRTRNLLVITEVALAMILLVSAGLLIRSFARLTSVNPGFEPQHLVKASLSLPQFQYSTPRQWAAFSDELMARLQAKPGMKDAAMVTALPILDSPVNLGFTIVGNAPLPPGTTLLADYVAASPGYFPVMGIPLLRGRPFNSDDSASTPKVALISATLARHYFSNQNPIGRRIVVGFPPDGAAPREIVGVVDDVRDVDLGQNPGPMIYVPFAQAPFWGGDVVVKSALSVSEVASAIQNATHSIDKNLPVNDIASFPVGLEASLTQARFRTLLLGLFSAVALLLAAVGIFGVISYSVSRRTQEIGVRMALGAPPKSVRRMVIGESATLVFCGLAVGIPAALILTHFLSTLLYGVAATDPLTFVGVSILLMLVAVAAAYIPARRAMLVNPMTALRCE